MKRAGPHSTLSPSQKTDAPSNAEGVRFRMCRPDSKEIGEYCEQGFDNVKSFGKERGSFWGGEDDRMAPPGRAVPVDASPRLTGIDSNAGSLSEERFPLPQFSVHPNEEVWTTESLNR